MKTYVVYDATADRIYLVKAENETDASAKLRRSFTDEQLRAEFQSLVDVIISLNKEWEHTNKWIDEQIAEGSACCLTKREPIDIPTYEEFLADYEINTEVVFELTKDITPLDETILMNYV